MFAVVPSLPAQSFTEIQNLAAALRGHVPWLQIDIVDGQFVPLKSWPFTEETDAASELRRLVPLTSDFKVDVDCMVLKPEQYLNLLVEIKIARATIHLRSTEAYDEIISHARSHGYEIAIAFTNDIPVSEVESFVDKVDAVQIMGIKAVGQQGQPFDERTLKTAKTLREKYPELEIAVDGSVNADTIVRLKDAGVNRFAPGSAIAKQSDPLAAYHHLCSLIAE